MMRINSKEPIATFERSIPAEQVDRFFSAVNWQQPTRPVMPPTLATVFRQGEFQALEKLNVSLHKVLHGEQKYRFVKPIEPGKTYRGETFLTNHFEKSGGSGAMNFYVFQTDLVDSATGELCVECSTTIIARG